MKALLEKAAISTGDRRVSYSWVGQPDALGVSKGIRLSFTHDKTRKRYDATFSRYETERSAGFIIERHTFDFGAGATSYRATTSSVARFAASSFAAFQAATIDVLTNDAGDAFAFICEAASLTMAEVAQ